MFESNFILLLNCFDKIIQICICSSNKFITRESLTDILTYEFKDNFIKNAKEYRNCIVMVQLVW
jgi:hypothetical protein